jgi:hypothetical protein
VECNQRKTPGSLPLADIRRPRDTPIWKLEAALKCRSAKGRSVPHVHMIKLTGTQEITPYLWVHPAIGHTHVTVGGVGAGLAGPRQAQKSNAMPAWRQHRADRKRLADMREHFKIGHHWDAAKGQWQDNSER